MFGFENMLYYKTFCISSLRKFIIKDSVKLNLTNPKNEILWLILHHSKYQLPEQENQF